MNDAVLFCFTVHTVLSTMVKKSLDPTLQRNKEDCGEDIILLNYYALSFFLYIFFFFCFPTLNLGSQRDYFHFKHSATEWLFKVITSNGRKKR